MNIKSKLLLLLTALPLWIYSSSSLASTNYTLVNNSNPAVKLVYDQYGSSDDGCAVRPATGTIYYPYTVENYVNTDLGQCTWAYVGYRIVDSGDTYIGYLSINVRYDGTSKTWQYSIDKKYTNGTQYSSDFGSGTRGNFQ
jgi:hypothetical protein